MKRSWHSVAEILRPRAVLNLNIQIEAWKNKTDKEESYKRMTAGLGYFKRKSKVSTSLSTPNSGFNIIIGSRRRDRKLANL